MLVLAVALGGCTFADPPASTTSADEPSAAAPAAGTSDSTAPSGDTPIYDITLAGLPPVVAVGKPFVVTVFANGSVSDRFEHLGGHFGEEESDSPSTAAYSRACSHTAGAAPGRYSLTCVIEDDGEWYFRGHGRVVKDGTTYDSWSEEETIQARAYSVSIVNPPATIVANHTVEFTVNVTGESAGISRHVGSHWSWKSFAASAPSTDLYDQTCGHAVGTTPASFNVSCLIPAGGSSSWTVYLRSHMRLTVDSFDADFWSEEYAIAVLAPSE